MEKDLPHPSQLHGCFRSSPFPSTFPSLSSTAPALLGPEAAALLGSSAFGAEALAPASAWLAAAALAPSVLPPSACSPGTAFSAVPTASSALLHGSQTSVNLANPPPIAASAPTPVLDAASGAGEPSGHVLGEPLTSAGSGAAAGAAAASMRARFEAGCWSSRLRAPMNAIAPEARAGPCSCPFMAGAAIRVEPAAKWQTAASAAPPRGGIRHRTARHHGAVVTIVASMPTTFLPRRALPRLGSRLGRRFLSDVRLLPLTPDRRAAPP